MSSAETSGPKRAPGAGLKLFWFAFTAGMGIFFPYFSLYLKDVLSLRGSQVGLVVAMIPLAGLLSLPLWGQLADRTGARQRVLAVAALGTGAAYLLLGQLNTFGGALFGTAVLSIFQASILPMATALTLASMGQHAFGGIRLWGTAGFLVAVVAFPPLMAFWSLPESGGHQLELLFPCAAACSVAAGLVALWLPRPATTTRRSDRGDLRRLFGHGSFLRAVFLAFAIHAVIQGPIHLFALYLDYRGGDAALLGRMWVAMLLLEIPLIGLSGRFLKRWDPRALICVGLVAEGLRWSVCALTGDLRIILAVQVLHGVGVTGVLVGLPLYVEVSVPDRLRSTAQTLVAASGFGAGFVLSSVVGGWAFEHLGAEAPYAAGGVGALGLAVLLWWLLPPVPEAAENAELRG